jgi:hypothetical protein
MIYLKTLKTHLDYFTRTLLFSNINKNDYPKNKKEGNSLHPG